MKRTMLCLCTSITLLVFVSVLSNNALFAGVQPPGKSCDVKYDGEVRKCSKMRDRHVCEDWFDEQVEKCEAGKDHQPDSWKQLPVDPGEVSMYCGMKEGPDMTNCSRGDQRLPHRLCLTYVQKALKNCKTKDYTGKNDIDYSVDTWKVLDTPAVRTQMKKCTEALERFFAKYPKVRGKQKGSMAVRMGLGKARNSCEEEKLEKFKTDADYDEQILMRTKSEEKIRQAMAEEVVDPQTTKEVVAPQTVVAPEVATPQAPTEIQPTSYESIKVCDSDGYAEYVKSCIEKTGKRIKCTQAALKKSEKTCQ